MKWIRERDALIAQTLAFVQSVTGKKDGYPPPESGATAFAVTTEIVTVRAVAVEADPPPAPLPEAPQPLPVQIEVEVAPPRTGGEFRREMATRIANFRKHQERFEREREEYCAATLTKLRAAIRDMPPRPPMDS
jgi:hypothetical protein